jgi:soluble lytic murein transglycosylase-like protein
MENGLMERFPYYLTSTAVWTTLAVVLSLHAAPSYAQSDPQPRHRAHAHSLHTQSSRTVAAILQDVAQSPAYGAFGGYADAATVARAGRAADTDRRADYAGLVEQHAAANGIPASLVHRVIMRESRYSPRAVSAGNYGIMQIRLGTARAMGYGGSAAGLLDAETNMTYAVRYLAGAYRAAHGNENLAVALYARGYNAPSVQQAASN